MRINENETLRYENEKGTQIIFCLECRVESLETVREWRVFKVTQKSQKAAISV